MPSRRIVVVQIFRPGPRAAGSGARLRSSRPRTIATGTPEMGLAPLSPRAASSARPSQSASSKPANITATAATTPGSSAASRRHARSHAPPTMTAASDDA